MEEIRQRETQKASVKLAIIIVGFNLYDYINYREIDWFYACLGVVMIFSSIFSIRNAKREISKEK